MNMLRPLLSLPTTISTTPLVTGPRVITSDFLIEGENTSMFWAWQPHAATSTGSEKQAHQPAGQAWHSWSLGPQAAEQGPAGWGGARWEVPGALPECGCQHSEWRKQGLRESDQHHLLFGPAFREEGRMFYKEGPFQNIKTS